MFHDSDEKIEMLEIANTDSDDDTRRVMGIWMDDWQDWYEPDREDVRIVAKLHYINWSTTIFRTVKDLLLHG